MKKAPQGEGDGNDVFALSYNGQQEVRAVQTSGTKTAREHMHSAEVMLFCS